MTPSPTRGLRWSRLSLRNKLTLVIIGLLAFGLTVAGIGTTLLLRPTLIEQMDTQLRHAASEPGNIMSGNPASRRFSYDNLRTAPKPFYVALLSESGDLLVDNRGEADAASVPNVQGVNPVNRAANASGSGGPTVHGDEDIVTVRDATGAGWRATAIPETNGTSGQVRGKLVIALPLSTVNSTMASFFAIFLGFSFTVVVFGAALTRLLVSATLRPLRRIDQTAMLFAAGDHSARLPSSPPNTEIGRLSRSLNGMLSRIDSAIEERDRTIARMRQFVGDASHELRTPLVTVRGYGELYRMGALDDPDKVALAMDRIEGEAKRMTGLVEDLLQLARIDEAKNDRRELLDLEMIVEDAAIDAHASAPDRPIRVLPVRVILDHGDADSAAAAPATQTPEPAMHERNAALDIDSSVLDGDRVTLPEELQAARAQREKRGAAINDILANTEAIPVITPEMSAADAPRGEPTDAASPTTGATSVVASALRSAASSRRDRRAARRLAAEEKQAQKSGEAGGRGRLMRMRRRSAGTSAANTEAMDAATERRIPTELREIPAIISGNPDKVRQSVQNIIGNAMRYTPAGSPLELGVTIEPAKRLIAVEIIDHGEGIPPEIRDKVFERFWRADTSRTRETGGSGLGLAIVSAILASHGGSVEIVETEGGGATFRLIFPLLLAEADEEPVGKTSSTA